MRLLEIANLATTIDVGQFNLQESGVMHTVSLDQAKLELEAVVTRVLANSEPTVVSTPAGNSVVMVPLDEFEAWQETAYLLRSPANAAHLARSIAESESDRLHQRELSE